MPEWRNVQKRCIIYIVFKHSFKKTLLQNCPPVLISRTLQASYRAIQVLVKHIWLALLARVPVIKHTGSNIRLPDLLVAFEESKLTSVNYYKKFLEKYERYDFLIIDEWLMQNISTEEQFFLFELIERRYGNSSAIFSTQYNKDEWLNILGVNVHSEAIVDRIIHNSVVIETGETNMRQILKC